ncbi:hypothetical protein DSUL_30118 [Desulfovibrionales bacterium]
MSGEGIPNSFQVKSAIQAFKNIDQLKELSTAWIVLVYREKNMAELSTYHD